MNDLNFFFVEKKNVRQQLAGLSFLLIIVVVAALVAAFYSFRGIQLAGVRSDIEEMQAYLQSEEIQTQLQEVQLLTGKRQVLQAYLDNFRLVDQSIDGSLPIGSTLLSNITGTLPDSVAFQAYSLTQTTVRIDGVSADVQSIAEMVHNLKETGEFSDVYLMNVTAQEIIPLDAEGQPVGEEQADETEPPEYQQLFSIQCTLAEGGAS